MTNNNSSPRGHINWTIITSIDHACGDINCDRCKFLKTDFFSDFIADPKDDKKNDWDSSWDCGDWDF